MERAPGAFSFSCFSFRMDPLLLLLFVRTRPYRRGRLPSAPPGGVPKDWALLYSSTVLPQSTAEGSGWRDTALRCSQVPGRTVPHGAPARAGAGGHGACAPKGWGNPCRSSTGGPCPAPLVQRECRIDWNYRPASVGARRYWGVVHVMLHVACTRRPRGQPVATRLLQVRCDYCTVQ